MHLGVDADDRIVFAGTNAGRNTVAGKTFVGSYGGELSPGGGVTLLETLPARRVKDVATASGARGFAILGDMGPLEEKPPPPEISLGGRQLPRGDYVARLNTASAVTWVQPLEGRAELASIAMDGAGNVFAVGIVPPRETSSTVAVLKYDARGALKWEKRLSGSIGGSSPSRDDSNDRNIVVHGDNLYLWIRSSEEGHPASGDLVKLGADGTEQWRRTIVEMTGGSNAALSAPHLAADQEGNLYAATTFNGTIRLADGTVLEDRTQRFHEFGGTGLLMKADPNGKLLFARSIATSDKGMFVDGLTVDGNDRPWVIGGFLDFVYLGTLRMDKPLTAGVPDAWTPAFLAGFDQHGRERQLLPLAWGAGRALVARSKDLLLTLSYRGDLLMKNVVGGRRFENNYTCVVLRVPTEVGEGCR
ncbi:hypothetical protein [Polyangium fumosum]|uniref:Uncharacterized protein n=1 Tax=Polyangium fumosum TaxID=889272 RepID=A0A4U1IUV0_9BACT|nr:hypothetical protein [Polyangium fumosum]TKC98166.1 hypothetical protein E8A74_42315 [Polyangium fumosum]